MPSYDSTELDHQGLIQKIQEGVIKRTLGWELFKNIRKFHGKKGAWSTRPPKSTYDHLREFQQQGGQQ